MSLLEQGCRLSSIAHVEEQNKHLHLRLGIAHSPCEYDCDLYLAIRYAKGASAVVSRGLCGIAPTLQPHLTLMVQANNNKTGVDRVAL